MIGWMVLAVLLVWLAVILVRACLYRPLPAEKVSAAPVAVDEEGAAARLQAMIRLKTVSYPDAAREDAQAFADFQQLLCAQYPHVTESCPREIIGRRGMLYRWQGRSDRAPSVLMAHYDVVPVNEGEWHFPPFDGAIRNGELWGRGTLDTKGTLHGVMEAAEALIAEGFVPENDVYFAFGGDEEVFGGDAPAIVAELEKRGIHPAFVLDEGGAIVENVFPGVSRKAALIGTAEKGAACADLIATGKGGHASAPAREQTLGILSRALCRVQYHAMPFTMTPPAREMFDILGRESSFGYRVLFANLWCFRPLLNLVCRLSGGEMNALVRTTCALTMAEGSKAYNVLPAVAKAGVNLRVISGDTMEDTCRRLEKIILDPRVEVKLVSGQNPSPVSLTGDEPWERLSQAIRAAYPGVLVSPYLMLAGSDSRHYGKISEHVYRFSGMPLSREQRGLIHNADERIPVAQIGDTIRFFAEVLRRC